MPLWPMAAHTAAKHQILRQYLNGWFPILGQTRGRILFFDGFAGPGIYADGEPGSPVVALGTLLDREDLEKLSTVRTLRSYRPASPCFFSTSVTLPGMNRWSRSSRR